MSMGDIAKVLVIDDERGPRESLRMLLKRDYDVTLAESVDRGMACLREIAPDLVILDLRMPDKSGIDGLRELRQIDSDIAVIILTGYGELETAREAIRHGANEYMKKPFDAREMMEAVDRNVARTRVNRRRSGAEQRAEELEHRIKSMIGEKDTLATLGMASSAFAHDVRNPLMIVMSYVEMLSEKLREAQSGAAAVRDEDIETYLGNIEENVDRCHKLAKDWNLLGKPDAIEFRDIDLLGSLKGVVRDSAIFGKHYGVGVAILETPDQMRVRGERSLLERALFNLCKNAVQAASCNPQGRVEVSASRRGEDFEIVIHDNGQGIDSDKLDWIFEPLKSDRAAGEGFGLGLFVTKEVVQLHNGSIEFDSEQGVGTSVVVKLPALAT